MKIGIYSDVHISRNSSIMPTYLNDNDILTTRLRMCSDSLEFMHSIFKKEKVNLIVNCGDTFNAHTVSADELSVYSNYNYKYNNPNEDDYIKEITLVGNHDMYNETFNTMYVKFNNVIQCDNPYYEYYPGECELGFISYEDDINKFKEKLNVIINHMLPEKKCLRVLFMHGDINGSKLFGTKRIENRISRQWLLEHFDIIINGHIHGHEIIYDSMETNKKIINIGSLTTHSFSDVDDHLGACYILDTNTGKIERFINPYQILFKSYEINTLDDINKVCGILGRLFEIDNNFKYEKNLILRLKCRYALKEIIDNEILSLPYILKSKIIYTYDKLVLNDSKEEIIEDKNNDDPNAIDVQLNNKLANDFIYFLNSIDDLKAPLEKYINIVNEVID